MSLKKVNCVCVCVCVLIFFGIVSCEKDFQNENNNELAKSNDYNQNDTRLYFASKESFKLTYESLKNKTEEEIYSQLSKVYQPNFIALRPIITQENSKLIQKKLRKRKIHFLKTTQKENLSNRNIKKSIKKPYTERVNDLEYIIGDRAFASLLNSDAEIQISNKIYKYTDVGLFITKTGNYDELIHLLETKRISTNLLIPTEKSSKSQILDEIPNGGYTSLENNITYYRSPIKLKEKPNKPIGGGPNPPPPNDTTQSLEEFLANLETSYEGNGTFGGLFGTNKVCIKEYDGGGRRVKLKAFNYDYGIAFHIGVKVKHQYKGWTGIWRKEDVDKIVLGVQAATFYYDFRNVSLSTIKFLDLDQAFYSPLLSKSYSGYYELGKNAYGDIQTLNYIPTHSNPYPYDMFNGDDLIVEVWSHNDLWDKYVLRNINKSLSNEKLNDYFYSTIWNTLKTQVRNFTKDFNYTMPEKITYMSKHPDDGILHVFKKVMKSNTNDAKIAETFGWGVGIGLTLNPSNGFKVRNANAGAPNLQKPNGFHATLFGATLSNGVWHGCKFSF